ncbi:MAG: metal ABC transporter substrate-binding protein, partial [Lachnospiraceae bacterium]|nr:metal ABC transporter substrate-binding protein [Lachnospiraceae bacterium]
MKKYISILIAAIMMVSCLSACGTANAAEASNKDKLQIVTTIFPEYDWVKNILGENPAGAEVTMLLDNGVDLHSYQPTADDIMKISTCDMFIYVGGESDEWVEDALK